MTVPLTYPGVYIREVPSGNRTIVGVATSITAFVGRADRGPAEASVAISRFADFERTFGGLARNSGLGYAVRDFFLNGGADALIVRVVHHEKPPEQPAARPRAGAPTERKSATTRTWEVDVGAPTKLRLTASGPGAWANALTVSVEHLTSAEADDVALGQGVAAADLFDLRITDGSRGEELHRNITLSEGPRRIDRALRSSGLLSVDGSVPDLPADSAKRRPPTGELSKVVVSGEDGAAPDGADYKRGIDALHKADLVNLLCVPPVTPEGAVPKEVWAEAATFCADHRAFLIIDPPTALTTAEAVVTWVAEDLNLTSAQARNSAVFVPRIVRSDPLRGGTGSTVVPSGAIAGLFARTDATRGVWKAPAGTEASLADAVPEVILTDGENGSLNPKGINCIRRFRDSGTVVWGSRTRRGNDALADDYKYVPVRRMALYLEETLYRSTQWAVFEPNDEPLWAQIRNSIGTFMQDLFRRGAFQGATPRDAFFVLCGKDTTTQYDIDRGIVNIRVGFAPLKPAEFVVISIEQKTAQPS
jgi:phage tail sheath protein FI